MQGSTKKNKKKPIVCVIVSYSMGGIPGAFHLPLSEAFRRSWRIASAEIMNLADVLLMLELNGRVFCSYNCS